MDKIELALDDCLQQLASGKSSLGQCLARYPQYAAELRPLLETALRLQQGRQLRPSGAVRDRTRARLARQVNMYPQRTIRPMPRFAVSLVALVLAVFLVTTAFAQFALPGDALYSLKLSTERAWRATSFDPLAVDLSLADRRADELVVIAKENSRHVRSEDAESTGIAAYNDVLVRLSNETDEAKSGQVLSALQKHQEKLLAAGIKVPELDEAVAHGNSDNGRGQGPSHRP